MTDPLAGLPRPLGDPGTFTALGSRYVGAGTSLGHTSQVLVDMVGRLLAQAWSGQAATAAAARTTHVAQAVAMAADSYTLGGEALRRYAATLAAAQAEYDAARRLADQAVADEQQYEQQHAQQAAATLLTTPSLLLPPPAWSSPLRALARSRAEQAVTDAGTAARQAAATLDQLTATVSPPPPPATKPHPSSHHWYSPITGFLDGAWDSVRDPAVMVGGLIGLHGDTGQNWANLGTGLWHGVTHPLDLGKAAIDWNDLSHGRYAHWAGELAPSIVAAFFTGGAAAAAKGADGVAAVNRTGKALADMTDAEKAAMLARGEDLAAGSVGKSAAAKFLTADGRLDYGFRYTDELANFRRIASDGPATLSHDLWLANVHDGSAALNAGRSLKWGAPLDEVLNHTRGGYLQRLALVPQWGPRTDMTLLHIPAGTQVHLAEGTAAAQVSTHTVEIAGKSLDLPTGVKLGGGAQVLLHDVDTTWAVWTGQAPWPTGAEVAQRAAAGGAAGVLTVRAPDVLADLAQPMP